MGAGVLRLTSLGCQPVAGTDDMRGCWIRYYDAVQRGDLNVNMELLEVEGEGHAF